MREAIVNGQPVQADADSPEEAVCLACGGTVKKRKRRTMDGQVTYYRHEREAGEERPLRYHPCRR